MQVFVFTVYSKIAVSPVGLTGDFLDVPWNQRLVHYSLFLSADLDNTLVYALNQSLHREHDEDYCGVVYTDSFETPRLIIVFDPNNLSVFCCIVTPALLSSWIISKMCQKNYSIKIQGVGNRWWETILINSLDG